MKKSLVQVLLAAACALGASGAAAQQCAGFTDVLATDPFCPNVEWLKNRGITLGCTATEYCPTAAVSRLAMAAFMNRLGNALTPELLGAQGAIDTTTTLPGEAPDPALVMCVTGVSAATNYPRKVHLTAMFSGLANMNTATFRAFLLMRVGGGPYQSVIPGTSAAARGTTPANGWDTVAMTEVASLDANQTYQFAVGVRQDQLTDVGGVLERARCQLSAAIFSRTGAASPF